MPNADARRATGTDVPQLVELMTEFYAEAGFTLPAGPAARTFEQLVDDPRLGAVWLLEAEGEPAGYVALALCFSMEYGGLCGIVDDLFVRPTHRRRGLASAGLAAVRRFAEAAGVRALNVETGPDNDDALGLYLRAGFTDTGRVLLVSPIASPVHAEG